MQIPAAPLPLPQPPKTPAARPMVGVVLAAGAAVLIVVASLLPYVRLGVSQGFRVESLAILRCEFPGCGWFAIEPIGLVVALVAVGVAAVVGAVPRTVAAALFGVFGLWTTLLFAAYALSVADGAYGPESTSGPAGIVGIAAGLLLLAAGVVSFLVGRSRPAPAVGDQDAT